MPLGRETLRRLAAATALAVLAAGRVGPVAAQRYAWVDEGFEYRRSIQLPSRAKPPSVVVAEFFAQGKISRDEPALAAYARDKQAPCRVLQAGPGDFFRIAVQTAPGQTSFQVYYGGRPAASGRPPDWTARDGLLLETRHWKSCNLSSFDSLRLALEDSEPFGQDYVEQVFHRDNPFAPAPGPFLSRYEGVLRAPVAGAYSFFTSSQDCSFLRIDGKPVVAAPGRHRPVGRARFRGRIRLTEGPHRFEYWHAASGQDACMVAAWQIPGGKKPFPIPPEVFRSGQIAHLPATPLEHRTQGLAPDFRVTLEGDVPLAESSEPLVRARLVNMTARGLAARARTTWDFGDGQTSTESSPTHVFLHPGPYRIRLRVHRADAVYEAVNRVWIGRPIVPNTGDVKLDSLAQYLPFLKDYDARSLDPAGLLQLARALVQAGRLEDAARAGESAFGAAGDPASDAGRLRAALYLGALMRDSLNDAPRAYEFWKAAGRSMRRSDERARCAVEAAELALNELLVPQEAQPLLEYARDHLRGAQGEIAGRLHRLWGDWHARNGDAQNARAAYAQAATLRNSTRGDAQDTAWRGAHSRSTEFFLREGDLPRARAELRQWLLDFPGDKGEGYLSLLLARYWAAAGRNERAIAVAGDLLTVRPDSPYADKLLFLEAACQEKLKRRDRAAAALQSLLTDYPGSPLVGPARERLEQLRSPSQSPRRRAAPGTGPKAKDARKGPLE